MFWKIILLLIGKKREECFRLVRLNGTVYEINIEKYESAFDLIEKWSRGGESSECVR
jgi:hypothetical protein